MHINSILRTKSTEVAIIAKPKLNKDGYDRKIFYLRQIENVKLKH